MFQITASPSAQSRHLWRRTGNFFKTFLQFYVYDLRFKAAGLTTFLVEFWTLILPHAHMELTLTVHIYEHHNRVPMLLSVIYDKIATLVWNFYWAHKFVAHWIRYSCVYFYLWPFRFVAVPVCGRSGLWPFRFVAVSVCGRSGLWPFRSVAVLVCGRLGFGRFGLWPLWPESIVTWW